MKAFCLSIIVTRTVLCMEGKGWWSYWIIIEINSLSFIVFLYKEKKREKTFIFFLFQTLSSIGLILFVFLSKWSIEQNERNSLKYVVIVSIIIKIGMFPFHNWIIKIIKNFSWVAIIILFTWQKIIPILIVIKIFQKRKKIILTILASIIILNFIILSSSNIKTIITVSSLIHNTWILLPLIILKEISFAYILSYTLILIPLVIIILKTNIKSIVQQIFFRKIKKEIKFLMFSIRRIPPSIGFLIKISILMCVIMQRKKLFIICIIIVSSCLSFFIYFRMLIKYFFREKIKNKKKRSIEIKNITKEVAWILIILPIIVWI